MMMCFNQKKLLFRFGWISSFLLLCQIALTSAQDCAALPPQTDGTMVCTAGVTSGSVCTFSCNIYYALSGPSSITCTSGLWSTKEPLCELGEGLLRLQHGTNTKGTLEISHSGSWGSICHDEFTDKSATVACQQMGLGNVGVAFKNSHFGNSTNLTIWVSDVSCIGDGSEVDLLACPRSDWLAHTCTHAMDVGIECRSSYAYRIVNGPTPNAGRVEIQGDGRWLAVCDVGFDINAANVTCNYLGYSGAISYHPGAQFGNGTEDIHYMGLICNGNENSLAECQHTVGDGDGVCSLADVVGVTCQGGPIRLQSTEFQNEGALEIYHAGQWGVISAGGLDDTTAKVACKGLGYGFIGYASYRYYFSGASVPRILYDMYCHGNETNLAECPHSGWMVSGSYTYGAGVYCHTFDLTDVRLVDGNVFYEGRVEIRVDGVWGTVCDDDWDLDDAHVICRMLGYKRAEQFYQEAQFGEGTGDILADDVDCQGNETHLLNCTFTKANGHDCGHSEDSSVKCYVVPRCVNQWYFPDTSKFAMARYLTDQSNYTVLKSTTTLNEMSCVRKCNTQARKRCGEPDECSMVTFDDATRSCTLYHQDNATSTITCGGTSTCYKNVDLE